MTPAIEDAISKGEFDQAVDRLGEYSNEVGDLFRTMNKKLKELCASLRGKTAGMETILVQCGMVA